MDDDDDLNLLTNCVERFQHPARSATAKKRSIGFEIAHEDDTNKNSNKQINNHNETAKCLIQRTLSPRKRPSSVNVVSKTDDPSECLDPPVKKQKCQQRTGRKSLPRAASLSQGHGDNKTRGIASSLFKSNPEIPEIKQKEFEQIKEKIFSTATFKDLNVHPYMISNLHQTFGIDKVTAVQEKVIPLIVSGRDVLVKSQTGSGKTLAYAIPIIQKLQSLKPKINRESGIFALIVLPTRELALQTYEWFHKLLRSFTWIVPACFMGGQKRKSEKSVIRRGANVLITTPQRLLDHLQFSEKFSLSKVMFLVLDEADRLTDMGYERDLRSIIAAVKEQINENPLQTILLSATLSQGVQKLAGLSMKNPITIDIAFDSSATDVPDQVVMPTNLHQYFVLVPAKLRLVTLVAFILWKCRRAGLKVLVFMPTQDMVDYHDKMLSYLTTTTDLNDDVLQGASEGEMQSFHVSQLHGNMPQQGRNEVFKKFRKAQAGVLLCTDVGSRGLDLPAVDWIIQYNAPLAVADYVHRVGRTARIGNEGSALLFLLPSESGYVPLLEESGIRIQQTKVNFLLESLSQVKEKGGQRKPAKVSNETTEAAATTLQLKCEKIVRTDNEMHQYAKKAFLSFVRAYHTYPSILKTVFQFKELHLGHVAKSLALQDTPTTLGSHCSSARKFSNGRKMPNERYSHERRQPSAPNPKLLLLSEYASG